MKTELITQVANIALTLSFIAALIFGVVQTRAAARDRRERLTLETLRNFQTREFAGLINYMTLRDLPANREEQRDMPYDDQVTMIHYAQIMESLGILVAEQLIDIDLVEKTLGTLVTSTWEKYSPVMLDMRKSLPDPFLCEYFQWLAMQIEKRMRENPRKPFFER